MDSETNYIVNNIFMSNMHIPFTMDTPITMSIYFRPLDKTREMMGGCDEYDNALDATSISS